MLRLENVRLDKAGQTVMGPVDLALERGSLNVLLGPTLSGKTTLMRLMAGLDRPTHGRVTFEGKDVTGVPVQRRNVAMVYQQFINYPSLTVYENVASPLRVAGRPADEIDRKVRSVAELLRLTPYLDRLPLSLSGGQQQRTAIARALVKDASLVLLDEPLANLDYKLREELRAELPRVFEGSGAIFVYATTEPSEALLLGGNTATLHEGRVTQFGPTLDVYRTPHDLRTAAAFSDPPLNTVAAEKKGGGLLLKGGGRMTLSGEAKRLPDGPVVAGFRPHHLRLDHPRDGGVEVDTNVVVTELTGSESYIHVDCDGARWVALAHGIHDVDPGKALKLHIEPTGLMLFDRDGRFLARAAAEAGGSHG
ncbi:MAG: ABC transporter ATP-binding protein [Hyphomicrobiales bacterium]